MTGGRAKLATGRARGPAAAVLSTCDGARPQTPDRGTGSNRRPRIVEERCALLPGGIATSAGSVSFTSKRVWRGKQVPSRSSSKPKIARSKLGPAGRSARPNRILTTHVGSLIRPPEYGNFSRATRPPALRSRSLRHLPARLRRRRHAQAGRDRLDIINDGEYGKTISWSRYVLKRMSGFEQRDQPAQAGMPVAVVGRDRREFAEFYADYDRHQGFTGMTGWALAGPIRYTGQVAIQRDIANFKAAAKGTKATDLFMAAVAPASVAPDRIDEYYERRRTCLPSPTRCTMNTRQSSMPG